jgi:hypothetical protein
LKISGSASVSLNATSALQRTLSRATDQMALKFLYPLVDREGLGNVVFAETFDVPDDSPQSFNLGDMGKDDFGETITFKLIYFLAIQNRAIVRSTGLPSTARLKCGDSSGWAPFLSPETGSIMVHPGGVFWWTAPQAIDVATMNRTLNFLNDGFGTLTFDLVIIGTAGD